jgi:DUF4097 and DUF4098 domain-containing protein YvlB
MNDVIEHQNSASRGYRNLLLLLIAIAVLSSASRDFERLQQFCATVQEIAANLTGHSGFTASAATIVPEEDFVGTPVVQKKEGQFRWNGRLANGKSVEIKGMTGDITAEQSSSDQIEVVANKHSRQSDVDSVSIKVLEHEDGVTICAVYPTDDPNRTTPCYPAKQGSPRSIEELESSPEVNMRSTDVHVDFVVKLPAGIDLQARTISGDIKADSLSSNVQCRTVNGDIHVSTSGYAEAKTVNGEIFARIGNPNWNGALHFKTVNGAINLDLPANVGVNVTAATFNGEISSDFPLTATGKINKRKFSGTIGAGGRDLILKTLNGSINLRRVS